MLRTVRPAWLSAVAALLLVAGCSGASSGTTGSGRHDSPSAPGSPSGSAPGSPPGSPSGPSSGPSRSASTPVPAATVPTRPRLGACYRLSAGALTRPASSAAPVGCVRDHTALTIFVGQLSTVVDGHAVGVDSTTVERQLASTCPAKLAAYVGGDRQQRALSRFSVVWFRPTPAQSDRGASWFRCDLVAFGRQGSLYPLPDGGDLSRVLDRTGALGTYGLCGTAAPGANGFRRVICARPHSWRAFSTVVLSGADYPGVDTLRQAGDGACRSRARAGLAGSLRFRYGWEWPTREQWRAGQHYGYCWAPS